LRETLAAERTEAESETWVTKYRTSQLSLLEYALSRATLKLAIDKRLKQLVAHVTSSNSSSFSSELYRGNLLQSK
jgi:hypothetical protein